ncbi:ABC-2 type transport system permease protein [Planomicrobium soli]|uniref:ABC-2 type transport system permease protein n=1 Tax=Planomicrobium soli TaxID=1176648 RepID=A0A2P8H225_9BACL|nr:ABC transporter permease [Planomicrobium soli]PSL40268.1 ABC-2 type transport system permease protein [Planomicrobium soli]
MGAFLKKDVLVLLRDRTEVAVLLGMPFILIAILGFALGGLIGGDTEVLKMQVAIVQEDDEKQGIEQFAAALNNSGMSAEQETALLAVAKETSPSTLLRGILADGNLGELVTTEEMEATAAEEALKDEKVVAILTLPENFTLDALRNMLLGIGTGSELQLTISDYAATQSDVFRNILDEFAWSLSFESTVSRMAAEEGKVYGAPNFEVGGIEAVSAANPINSMQYYTIGMAVMFSLFVAGTIGSKAFVERQQFVFDRILLSDRNPLVYLGSKAITAAAITFCQLAILFVFSSLIFQTFDLTNLKLWPGIALIAAVFAICVGTLASLLTALTIRLNNETVNSVFSGSLVILFAFLGGSFMPTEGMPVFIREVGDWTPNGAALTAFLIWLQEMEIKPLWGMLNRVLATSALLLLLSLLLFPRKGAA